MTLVILISSLILSYGICRLLMRVNVLDHPDGDRKQQDAPVPRLGGLGILAATLMVSAPLILLAPEVIVSWLQVNWQLPALVLGAVLLGLWDDIWTAPTVLKLLLLVSLCLALPATGLTPDTLTSPWGETSHALLLILGSAAWLLVFVNATNFMDGSNGLAMGALAIMFLALALSVEQSDGLDLMLPVLALCGAVIGFLTLNLNGKIYAGDAGALGLGALFAGFGLLSGRPAWTTATIALPFLVDVLLTLIWRAKQRRSWLKAHRDHAYQRLMDQDWSHVDVAILYWGLTAVCGFAAWLGAQAGGAAPFAIFWALTLAGTLLWSLQRRLKT